MKWVALALVLLAVPAVAQVAPASPIVSFDVVHRLDPSQDLVVTLCDDAAVDVDARGFLFREATGSGGQEGYMATGCATVRHTMTVPSGIEHFHVFFDADRQVEQFTAQAPVQFIQEVQVVSTGGDGLASRRMFDINSSDADLTPFNFVFLPPAGGEQIVHVDWFFQDIGFGTQEDIPNPFSGVDARSRVENIIIETSGVPAAAVSAHEQRWTGTSLVREWRVDVAVDEAQTTDNLRVRLDDDYTFAHVELPDGTTFDLLGTRTAAGPDGYDKSRVLGENLGDVYQVTVPAELLAAWGPGDYTVVFQSKDPAEQDPILVGVAIVMAMTPLPFGVLAVVQVTRFRRQAFGGFARAATHLRTAVALVLAYYGVVMLAALFAGRLHFLAILPLTGEGVLLYAQVLAAVVAFIVLWLVARELDRLTRPAEDHAS